ncbi:hypothetical protein ACFWSF_38430 [Streptomyces sp. NPDC058611]|uniref:hypothetical protein n=1 Tax=unclassified Streptomyces TaxID=2593676 RepID=UPI00365F9F5D
MKAVLFDMFGVLARLQSPESQTVLQSAAGVDRERFWAACWSQRAPYDRGDVAGPAYWEGVCETLGIPLDARRTADLIAADLAVECSLSGSHRKLACEAGIRWPELSRTSAPGTASWCAPSPATVSGSP